MAVVLVVEDDDDLLEMMTAVLTGAGHTVLRASNGLEAFRRMEERRPDLIVLDMQMPVMDGWAFRQLQMRDPRYADVPAIAVSALFDPLDVARKLGIRCLQKPLDVDTVLQEVEAIDRRRGG